VEQEHSKRDEDTYRVQGGAKTFGQGDRLITTGWSKNIGSDEDNYRVKQEHREG
jgi:hypothetical protein